jgi:hypothetical protein
MMRRIDLVGFAAGAIAAHPMRSALTSLGVVIGVAAVVMMTSIGLGAQQRVTSAIGGLGSNLLIVSPGASRGPGGGFVSQGAGSGMSLNDDDAEAIGKLDGAIPFLDLGGDAPVEPAPTTEPTAPAPADASQPATTPTTDAAPRQPREQLLGTWISATPNRVYSLTLLSDGKFLLDTAAPTGLQRGTWKRESQRITLMPDSTPAAQAPTPNTTTSQPSQPAPQLVSPAPSPQTLEIAHQSTRSVTFIDGNTLIVVRLTCHKSTWLDPAGQNLVTHAPFWSPTLLI